VAMVLSLTVVNIADSSPMRGGFIIKFNPPCTLQNCRGTLLLLSLIDMIRSLWPQPPILTWPWMTGWTDGRMDGWVMRWKNFTKNDHDVLYYM
jgi:hypothetical protein